MIAHSRSEASGPRAVSRRDFLKTGAVGGATLIGGPALLGACARSDENDRQGLPDGATEARFVEFYGPRQTGIAPEWFRRSA